MSLINDALRKARREAAEREAEARGAVYRPPRAHLPEERSHGALIGVLVGLVLALAGTGVGWWLSTNDDATEPAVIAVLAEAEPRDSSVDDPPPVVRRQPVEPEPVEPQPVDSEPAMSASVAREPEPGLPEPEPEPPPPSAPEPVATLPVEQARPRPIDPPVTETLVEEPPVQPFETAEPAPEPDPPAPRVAAEPAERTRAIREPERTGRVEPDVFVLEATVDGTALQLDFIIYSPTAPFAQINGEQVSAGQVIDGWSVVAVEREQVQLRKGPRDVVLRIR